MSRDRSVFLPTCVLHRLSGHWTQRLSTANQAVIQLRDLQELITGHSDYQVSLFAIEESSNSY